MSWQPTRLPGFEPPGFGSALRISKSPRWHSSMTRRCCRRIGATSNRSLGFGLKIGFTRRRRQQENTEPSAPADRLRPETFPTIQGRSWAAPAAEPEHSATSHANKRCGSRLLCSLSSPGALSAISGSRAFGPPRTIAVLAGAKDPSMAFLGPSPGHRLLRRLWHRGSPPILRSWEFVIQGKLSAGPVSRCRKWSVRHD